MISVSAYRQKYVRFAGDRIPSFCQKKGGRGCNFPTGFPSKRSFPTYSVFSGATNVRATYSTIPMDERLYWYVI